MPKTGDFSPMWPDYPCGMPSNEGAWGGSKGGDKAGTDSQKETSDKFGPKVTYVETHSGPSQGEKVTPSSTADAIATPTVRQVKPLK